MLGRSLVLLSVLTAVDAHAFRRVGIAYPAAIVVDGDLSEWNVGLFGVSPPIEIGDNTFLEEGTVTSGSDHFARVFVAYETDALFVAAIITDDHVVSKHRGAEMWRGDMFEVLFPHKDELLHLGFNPSGDAHIFNANMGPRVIESAARIEAPGWVFEARIPFGLVDTPVRCNFAVRDADPNEQPPAHRVWSGYRHNRAASLGEILLQPAKEKAAVDLSSCPRGAELAVDAPLKTSGRKLVAGKNEVRLRILNFQSEKRSWNGFWTRFDKAQIDRDLDLAAAMGANTIRFFPPFAVFGTEPNVEKIRYVIDAAKTRGMLSIPSLFPDLKEFRKERYGEMEAYAKAIVAAFKDEPAIAMWDLMNEADHGFGLPGAIFSAKDVYAWAQAMSKTVRAADPNHLLTIGLAGYFAKKDNAPKEEILGVGEVTSIHWYFEPSEIGKALDRAKRVSAGPVVLQELGATSMYEDEASAVKLYHAMCSAADKAGVAGFGAWELYDHPVGTIETTIPRYRETEENHYGLAGKQQSLAFCRCLGALPRFKIK